MTITIDLQNDSDFTEVPDTSDFQRWVTAAMRSESVQLEQTICVVDEAQSRELNRRFGGRDNATNVLAFPADSDYLDYDCLGDLVLCAPLVVAQARQQNKAVSAHWAHLVVHGMLHLQGYDHQNDAEANAMEALEVEILDTLGYTNPYNDQDC